MSSSRNQTPALVTTSRPLGAQRIAVASGKGGVGKTWLSVTLAAVLGQRGYRPVLVDGDLGLANVDVQLGLTPKGTLTALVRGDARVDGVLSDAGDFDVVSGTAGDASLAAIEPAELERIVAGLDRLAGLGRLTVLDLGAGINRTVIRLASTAQRIIVVLTPDPSALTDAYALLKVLRSSNSHHRASIVVNMVESEAHGERTHQALATVAQTYLGFAPDCLGYVRRDDSVRRAIRQQTSLLSAAPDSKALKDINTLTDHLIARQSGLAA